MSTVTYGMFVRKSKQTLKSSEVRADRALANTIDNTIYEYELRCPHCEKDSEYALEFELPQGDSEYPRNMPPKRCKSCSRHILNSGTKVTVLEDS